MAEPLEKTGVVSPAPELRLIPGNLRENSQSDSRNSQITCRKKEWSHPLSSTEIAEVLNTDRRNITNWYSVVRKAYCWMNEPELKTGAGKATRYTPFCCEQFESLMAVTGQGKSYDDWIASVQSQHPDDYTNWVQTQSVSAPEVIDAEPVEPPISTNQGSIVIQASQQPIAVHQVNQINLTVINTQPQVNQALDGIGKTLDLWTQNTQDLESALLQTAEHKGAELGAKVAIAKVGKLVETSEQVELALAEKLGLLGKQPVPGSAPSAG